MTKSYSSSGSESESPRPTSSIDDSELLSHSTTKSYLEKEETHERIALGDCSRDVEAAVENHCEKVKEEIKETDEKLDGMSET